MSEINFSMIVERKVLDTKMSYIDVIVDLCEEYEIEFEMLRSMLNKNIKEKVELEAKRLNMMVDNEISQSLF